MRSTTLTGAQTLAESAKSVIAIEAGRAIAERREIVVTGSTFDTAAKVAAGLPSFLNRFRWNVSLRGEADVRTSKSAPFFPRVTGHTSVTRIDVSVLQNNDLRDSRRVIRETDALG
jgi:hypothetical protein